MSERPQNRSLCSVKFNLNYVSATTTSSRFKIRVGFSIISLFNCKYFNKPKHVPWCQSDWAACSESRSCSWVLSLLYMCLDVYVGGKLIRYCEYAQRYASGKYYIVFLYRLYILSITPNLYISIIHAISAMDLKQAVFLCTHPVSKLIYL